MLFAGKYIGVCMLLKNTSIYVVFVGEEDSTDSWHGNDGFILQVGCTNDDIGLENERRAATAKNRAIIISAHE